MPSFSFLNFRMDTSAPSTATGGTMQLKRDAVGKTGVAIGVALVDPAAHGGHDLVDDPQKVAFVLEGDVGQGQLAVAFDEDALGAVDQNIVDGFVFQQGFQRTQTHHLVKEVLVQGGAVFLVQRDRHFVQRFGDDGGDFDLEVAFGGAFKGGEVKVFQKALVQFDLQLAELFLALAVLVDCCNLGGRTCRHDRDLGRSRSRGRRCAGLRCSAGRRRSGGRLLIGLPGIS